MARWAENALRNLGLTPAKHHRLLMKELDALSRGESDRLIVQMPPGSAKSTYASILMPAWWLASHPQDSIVAASHTVGLARNFGRFSRNATLEEAKVLGYQLAEDNRASDRWSTCLGGSYYAVGIRGAIVGRRADIAIVDDPIKSQSEADNLAQREFLWSWYKSELTPRLKPKGRVLLVMTRWHQDDLCGRLLAHNPDEWRCVSLPALAEEGDQLHRNPGEPLWPEWEDSEALLRRRLTVGERTWTAQFQQSPQLNTGSLFKVANLALMDALLPEKDSQCVRAWDLAATEDLGGNDPDWTVGLKLMRHGVGRFTIVDVIRMRGSSGEVEARIAATARMDGPNVTIGLPQDPGQAGKSQVSYLTKQLAGFHVQSSLETGAKSARARPVASQIEMGNFSLLRGSWNHAFVEELQDFPYGRKDDQVDALSRAFVLLLDVGSSAQTIPISHMAR
jgi:predicted phage terminase large subunit-like protein